MSSNNSKQNHDQLPTTEVDDAYQSALVLCFSRIMPAVLNAAIDLNLFEIITKAEKCSSMSASEIASHLPNYQQHPELANRLERMLPVLASYSLLNCSIRTNEGGKRERVYSLTPIGEYFACDGNNGGGSLAPLSTLIHRGYHDIWNDAKDAIVDPNNNNHFHKLHGLSIYQYLEKNTELNHLFNKAMAQCGPLEMKRILQLYKGFEGVSTLVDVGGGVGQALQLIISQYPSIKGVNFDLPQVIQHAPPLQGIEHVPGNMFESVPQGDAILLKLVCHNWADEECVMFLRNCYKALPKGGKVIVLDYIMPEVPNPSNISKHVCAIDNVMFLINAGKERTENEFKSLCMRAGFSKFCVPCSDFSAISGVMEFHK